MKLRMDDEKEARMGGWASAVSGSAAFRSAGCLSARATESCAAGGRDIVREKGYDVTALVESPQVLPLPPSCPGH
jgi:hypothetical protein